MLEALKPCPNCQSDDLKGYVQVRCNTCGMCGPHTNQGRMDDHADSADKEQAYRLWNALPRIDEFWVTPIPEDKPAVSPLRYLGVLVKSSFHYKKGCRATLMISQDAFDTVTHQTKLFYEVGT